MKGYCKKIISIKPGSSKAPGKRVAGIAVGLLLLSGLGFTTESLTDIRKQSDEVLDKITEMNIRKISADDILLQLPVSAVRKVFSANTLSQLSVEATRKSFIADTPVQIPVTPKRKQAAADAPAFTLPQWIRPDNAGSPPVWGIRDGIVVALWPAAIENIRPGNDGGPRGLLRIGYEWKNIIYHINYIAIEPVVAGNMEFSEISPSQVDGKWGKLMWAGETPDPGRFSATAGTRGVITQDTVMPSATKKILSSPAGSGITSVTSTVIQPDVHHPEKEILYLYVFMEKFMNGAHPYLRLSISSDHPDELGIEIFQQPDSAPMERCGITATMGNYSRLRSLYLKNKVVNAKQLYAGYHDIDFTEHAPYPAKEMLRNNSGDFIVLSQPDESLNELTSWPDTEAYMARWNWRYRPFYKLTQYWRVAATHADNSLQVRVNGRAKYWSGGTRNAAAYIDIPGGPAFENFELRAQYKSGQQFYFGLSRKTIPQLLAE